MSDKYKEILAKVATNSASDFLKTQDGKENTIADICIATPFDKPKEIVSKEKQ